MTRPESQAQVRLLREALASALAGIEYACDRGLDEASQQEVRAHVDGSPGSPNVKLILSLTREPPFSALAVVLRRERARVVELIASLLGLDEADLATEVRVKWKEQHGDS